jgi:hypothetical protein
VPIWERPLVDNLYDSGVGQAFKNGSVTYLRRPSRKKAGVGVDIDVSGRGVLAQSLASLDDSHPCLIRFAARLSIAPISARLHTDAWRTARDEDGG